MREVARALTGHPSGIGSSGDFQHLDRCACESTVLHVFSLIWPHAGIACSSDGECCLVEVQEGGLRHRIRVPWTLVEFDRGLLLVRAVYRAGLPCAFQSAVSGLSSSL